MSNFDTIGIHYDGRIKEFDFTSSVPTQSINIPILEQVNISLEMNCKYSVSTLFCYHVETTLKGISFYMKAKKTAHLS